MPERRVELTPEERLKLERQMQIDSRILESTPPPGPTKIQIVFDSKEPRFKIEHCDEPDFEIGHIITKCGNNGWRDSYRRIPERDRVSKVSIELETVIPIQPDCQNS
jgi:hypothetical protein